MSIEMVTYTSWMENPRIFKDRSDFYANKPNTEFALADIISSNELSKLQNVQLQQKWDWLADIKSPQFGDNVMELINICSSEEEFQKVLNLVMDWYFAKWCDWLNEHIATNGDYFSENIEFNGNKEHNKSILQYLYKWKPSYLISLHPFAQLKNKEKEFRTPEENLFDTLARCAYAKHFFVWDNKEFVFSALNNDSFNAQKVKAALESYFWDHWEAWEKIQQVFTDIQKDQSQPETQKDDSTKKQKNKKVVFRFDPNGTYLNVFKSFDSKGKTQEELLYSSHPEQKALTPNQTIGM